MQVRVWNMWVELVYQGYPVKEQVTGAKKARPCIVFVGGLFLTPKNQCNLNTM